MEIFFFKKNGRIRGWLRKVIFQKNGATRPVLGRIYLKKNGSVRKIFTSHAALYAPYQPKHAEQRINYKTMLAKAQERGRLARAQTIHIVSTPHTIFVAKILKANLHKTRFTITISTAMPEIFNHDLYFVICPQMFDVLPPKSKTLAFQMEQLSQSKWFNQPYGDYLQDCLCILDYSITNISFLIEKGFPQSQLYYIPIQPITAKNPPTKTNRDIDILFYGTAQATRRVEILKKISEKYDVTIVENIFGDEMQSILQRTKIVLNIHNFENALLETTRLSEAISNGARVVSETACDQNLHHDKIQGVSFAPEGDTDAMICEIDKLLNGWNDEPLTPAIETLRDTRFCVLRALHGLEIIDMKELEFAASDLRLDSERVVLALPEQMHRYIKAMENKIDGSKFFFGLRNITGWKGCAFSYKFLAKKALVQNFETLIIHEDDATFDQHFDERFEAAMGYLNSRKDEWDIFSGIITDLKKDTVVSRVFKAKDDYLIDINSLTGTVFCMYSRPGMQLLADFEVLGNDAALHTIDRYIEQAQPKIVTISPPLCGHDVEVNSSIWDGTNASMTGMINSSLARLDAKLMDFLQAEGDKTSMR